ncbi:galactose-specific cell agglutination protein gsf2-like [Puntigrus tetrazona]|uniref:galactose-specific cell agglutination protein gsf2-like n=1 Tax=Puntigrus tetrazona TaxID=1606681 RepID=UPI001C89D249|nr:galactose-specific cell agglutination protein gsf2-like [Puntigrus tetrazona]
MIRSAQQNKMKFTLYAGSLLFIGWMSVVLAADGPPPDCCITVYNTRISPENILSFTLQEKAMCPVRAVRFLTRFNKVICSDPESIWAKRVITLLGRRTTTTSAMCSTITTNTSPTTVTTDITSGTDTEISTSTNVTPAVMTLKTPKMDTSTSIIVPTTATSIETSRSDTEISKTTIQPTSVSTDDPESTAITCATGETTATSTEERRETAGKGEVTPLNTFTTTDNTVIITTQDNRRYRTKLSKLRKKPRKSKKGLRKYQMRSDRLKNNTR